MSLWKKYISIAGASFLALTTLAGCSTTKPSTQNNSTVASTTTPANPYKGTANLAKLENAAKAQPNNATAQTGAGNSALANGNVSEAISYYKKAVKLNPKSGPALNELGNVYFRQKGDPKTAIVYYRKATVVAPTYADGWWNLAVAQLQIKDKSGAETTLKKAMASVRKSDPMYKNFKPMLERVEKQK